MLSLLLYFGGVALFLLGVVSPFVASSDAAREARRKGVLRD